MSGLVAVIDYGSGNLRSVANALSHASSRTGPCQKVQITANPQDVTKAERIVLPGVGAFADCWRGLASLPGMIEALTTCVIVRGTPFLGICVGMQLMAEEGHEHGLTKGLGWLRGKVTPMTPKDPGLKIPHMGWNALSLTKAGTRHTITASTPSGAHAYFVHSYAFQEANPEHVLAIADHGGDFPAIVGRDNLIGTQFHPEKSQAFGLSFLEAFLEWRP